MTRPGRPRTYRGVLRFAVVLSDPAAPQDRVVTYKKSLDGARDAARRLNADLLARCGGPMPGRPLPLYHALHTGDCGLAGNARRAQGRAAKRHTQEAECTPTR
jgi:hypothetical protein